MNPADQRFEERLYKRIAALERALIDIKTAQPIGADSLSVLSSNLGSITLTLAPGEAKTFSTIWAPSNNRLQLLDVAASFFIDNDLDENYLFRGGASLSADQLKLRRNDWLDWALSNDTTGVKTYKTLVDNLGSSSHTIYFYSRAYYLKGGAT